MEMDGQICLGADGRRIIEGTELGDNVQFMSIRSSGETQAEGPHPVE